MNVKLLFFLKALDIRALFKGQNIIICF